MVRLAVSTAVRQTHSASETFYALLFASSICPSVFLDYFLEAIKLNKQDGTAVQALFVFLGLHESLGSQSESPLDKVSSLLLSFITAAMGPNDLSACSPTSGINALYVALSHEAEGPLINLVLEVLKRLPPIPLTPEAQDRSKEVLELMLRNQMADLFFVVNDVLGRFQMIPTLPESSAFKEPARKPHMLTDAANQLEEMKLLPEIAWCIVQMVRVHIFCDLKIR